MMIVWWWQHDDDRDTNSVDISDNKDDGEREDEHNDEPNYN